MKIGLYAGSFNPWHKGHEDVLNKALQVFDKVAVIKAVNPDKFDQDTINSNEKFFRDVLNFCEETKTSRLIIDADDRTLKEIVKAFKPHGIIRGLRNGYDLQYEMNQQYWNEDVGIDIPFVYFITDRSLGHVSSSAIRMVEKLGLEHDY